MYREQLDPKPAPDVSARRRGGVPHPGSFEQEGPCRSSAPRDGTNGPSDSDGSRGARCRDEAPHLGGVQEPTPLGSAACKSQRLLARRRARVNASWLGGVQGPTPLRSAACKNPRLLTPTPLSRPYLPPQRARAAPPYAGSCTHLRNLISVPTADSAGSSCADRSSATGPSRQCSTPGHTHGRTSQPCRPTRG